MDPPQSMVHSQGFANQYGVLQVVQCGVDIRCRCINSVGKRQRRREREGRLKRETRPKWLLLKQQFDAKYISVTQLKIYQCPQYNESWSLQIILTHTLLWVFITPIVT